MDENQAKVEILRNGEWVESEIKDIKGGDIFRVPDEDMDLPEEGVMAICDAFEQDGKWRIVCTSVPEPAPAWYRWLRVIGWAMVGLLAIKLITMII